MIDWRPIGVECEYLPRTLAVPGSENLNRVVCFKCWVERGSVAVSKLHTKAEVYFDGIPSAYIPDITSPLSLSARCWSWSLGCACMCIRESHPTGTARCGHTLTPAREDELALTRFRTPDTTAIHQACMYDIHLRRIGQCQVSQPGSRGVDPKACPMPQVGRGDVQLLHST